MNVACLYVSSMYIGEIYKVLGFCQSEIVPITVLMFLCKSML